ncbi:MAG: ABC transporter permease, partial [Rhizobacter sp.]|nr:ABC transporter permease [Rhizobacter sp.]
AVKAAPTGYESSLRDARMADPVLLVPEGFEAALLRGEVPALELVSDSANKQADAGAGRLQRLLAGYSRERAMLSLAYRGVSAELLEPMQVHEIDLASTQTRATQLTGLLPFFVMIAVLYGALNAALDSTAGERERGSLEPLLMNPAERIALVLGKWAAVVSVAMLIAVLSCFSFIPAQALLQSDRLQALFQFGPGEALLFIAVLLPFAAALSALLMAVAIRCRSVKEAQANSGVVILLVSLLPLVSVFSMGGGAAWHLWVPGLAQNTLMTRVLKGEGLGILQVAPPVLVCLLLTGLCLAFVTRRLQTAALR